MQELLTEKEFSKRTKLSVGTLRVYRAQKKLFDYVKLNRSVRYLAEEADKVIQSKVIKAES